MEQPESEITKQCHARIDLISDVSSSCVQVVKARRCSTMLPASVASLLELSVALMKRNRNG
jgi:hypothetical protein